MQKLLEERIAMEIILSQKARNELDSLVTEDKKPRIYMKGFG